MQLFHTCHSAGMFDVKENHIPSFIKGVAITSCSACWPTRIYERNDPDNFTTRFQKFLNGHSTYAELCDEVKWAEDDAAVKQKYMIPVGKYKSINDIEIQLDDATLDSTSRLLQTRIQKWMDAIREDFGDNIRFNIELPIESMQNDVLPVRTFNEIRIYGTSLMKLNHIIINWNFLI